jgi:hypothetical protein
VQKTSSFNVRDDQQVRQLLGIKEVAATPAAPAPVAAPVTPSPAPSPAPTPARAPASVPATAGTYKIGDTGPAGGLIFYDKGNNAGGWRYLEAAPEDAEFRAAWSDNSELHVAEDDYNKTLSDIGSGKRNTELIVEKFRKVTGNWNTAAQKAHDLSLNGFDDWFLPSQTELDQIFGNLKRKNLGGFKDEWYWSSTEGKYYGWTAASRQNFRDGKMVTDRSKGEVLFVRPVRQVAGQ